MKKQWSSYLACCLIMLIHTGLNSVATAAMPSLRAYYNTGLTEIVLGASVCCVSAFIAVFFADRVIQRLRPKRTLLLGSLCGTVFCLILSLSKNLWSFYVGCFFAGLLVAWGTYATCNVYIRKMDRSKWGILTSAMITVGLVGSASFQVLTGILLKNGTVPVCYSVMAGISVLAILINLVAVEDVEAENPKQAASGLPATGLGRLLKDPVFVLLGLVVLLGPAYIAIFSSLFTSILQAKGMDPAQSAVFLSAYTFLGGLMALVTGKIFDRFPMKTYVLILYGAYFAGGIAALLWDSTGLFVLLLFMILAYAVSMPISSLYNLMSGPLFGDMALSANTKLMSIAYFGSTVILPAFSNLYQTHGFRTLWIIMLLMGAFCMVLVLSAIRMEEKKDRSLHAVIKKGKDQ